MTAHIHRRARNTNTVCRTLVVQQGNVDVFASHAIRSCSLSSLHRCIDSVLHIHFSCECTVRIDNLSTICVQFFFFDVCVYVCVLFSANTCIYRAIAYRVSSLERACMVVALCTFYGSSVNATNVRITFAIR